MKAKSRSKSLLLFHRQRYCLVVLVLSVLWLGLAATPALADDIVVDEGGTDAATCGSEVDPCRTIAYAVTSRAVEGDVVIVNAGIYTETIAMQAGVVISGTDAATTIIDGEGARGPMVNASSDVTSSAVLQGVTIRHGIATEGGGIYVAALASPVLRHVSVISNTALRGGGMFVADTASPQISGLTLSDNYAAGTAVDEGGGGIYVGGSLTLTDTCMISNTAAHAGGGLYQYAPTGWVTIAGGCFEKNTALGQTDGNGGGASLRGNLVMTGTHVTENWASRSGGGVFVQNTTILTNVDVISNTASLWGGGVMQNEETRLGYYTYVSGGRIENNRVSLINTGEPTPSGGGLFSASAATIIGTDVISNAAYDGGGLHFSRSITLSHVNMLSNTATMHAGALDHKHLLGSSESFWARITDSLFENNIAYAGNGGAIRSELNVAITRTQIISNSAPSEVTGSGYGGGVYVRYNALVNDTHVLRNTAGCGGGGFSQAASGARVDVVNSAFNANTMISSTSRGGGLAVYGTTMMTTTEILTNTAMQSGGGIAAGSDILLQDVTIAANRAGQSGGGLYQSSGVRTAIVRGGVIANNVAAAPYGWNGGGGVCSYGTIAITGTQVISNVVGQRGGGLYAYRTAQVVNSVFARNAVLSWPNDGAAVYMQGESGAQTLTHVTVVSRSVGSGSAIYVNNGTVGISNTIVSSYTVGLRQAGGTVDEDYNLYFGTPTAARQRYAGTMQSGPNSILDQDPLFVDLTTDDYHIRTGSAALDAGYFYVDIAFDLDGNVRPIGNDVDVGAYEIIPDTFCDITAGVTYWINASQPVTITVDTPGDIACLTVTYTDTNHLDATSGIATGRYWNISATDASSNPVTTGFSVTLTLPVSFTPDIDDKLCRHTGSGWDCAADSFDTVNNTITRMNVTEFSDWAVGDDVGPNAVSVLKLTAQPNVWWLMLGTVLLGALVWRRR